MSVTEPETEWHAAWKHKYKKNGLQIEKRFDNYIADSYDPRINTVIEFQHSQITAEKLRERYDYYTEKCIKMRWIFDYIEKRDSGQIGFRRKSSDGKRVYYTFQQKWQRKILYVLFDNNGYPKCEVFFNIVYDYEYDYPVLFKIKKLYNEGSGWGDFVHIYSEMRTKFFIDIKQYNLVKELFRKYNFKKKSDNSAERWLERYISEDTFLESTPYLLCDNVTVGYVDNQVMILYNGYEQSEFLRDLRNLEIDEYKIY